MRRYWLVTMAVGLFFLLAACATGPPQTHPHLMVDPEGYALDDAGDQMTAGAYKKRIEDIVTKVEEHVKTSRSRGETAKILVHVHGGLVNQAEGLQFIEDMVDDDGLLKGTDYYPVFINWDASLGSSLYDDIFEVRRGTRDPLMGYPTAPFVALSRLVAGIARLPVTLVYQYDTEKMQFESWDGEDRSWREHIGNGIVTVVSLPITVVSLPFISGFGEGAWKMLRRRTDQMFAYQIRPEKHILFDRVEESGALRRFFRAVAESTRIEGYSGVEITLVGHSMGAIVVNQILRSFPEIKFDSIIYLAAASSIEDFIDTAPRYLERHPQSDFYSFSLSNRDEGGEFNYFLPRGSLLVWIDNMYEPGVSPTDKRMGFFRNEDIIKITPKDDTICPHMRFVKFTGLKGQPKKHGAFNNDGVYQRILEMASPDEFAKLKNRKGYVLHFPCKQEDQSEEDPMTAQP